MSTRKVIDIEVTLENGDKVIKQFEDLGNGVLKVADSVDNLDAKFEDVFEGIEPLTTRLGEAEDRLYELALAGDTTSKEYQDLLTKVSEYRKVQIQTDLAVDQAAQTFSQKLGTAITGATSGFAAVQGAMGLVGVESETLEKTLLKVQSALALQQGVQGVLDYTKSIGLAGKATKVFNLIVKGNPLALFATALVAIISSLAIFTDAIDIAIKKLKSITDFLGLTNFAEQELEAERKKRHEAELKRKKAEDEAAKKAEAAAKKQAEEEKRLLAERLAAFKEYTANRLAAARQIQDLEIQLMEDGLTKELKQNEIKFQRLREDALSNQDLTESERLKKIQLFGDLEKQARLKIIENNVDQATDAQLQELQILDEFGQMKIEKLQLQAKGEVDVEKQKNEEILQDNRKTNAQIREDNMAQLQSRLQMTSDVFGAIGGLATALSKDGEKNAKKAFRINKAVSIAQAVISTAQGVISQLAVPQDALTGANFVKAAIVAATGAAQIATISKTKFQGGGGGGGADIQSPQSGGAAQAPQFNVVGDSGINQLASLQQEPVQAFVVSGEVTTAQALDRNRVQNATL